MPLFVSTLKQGQCYEARKMKTKGLCEKQKANCQSGNY